MKIKPLYDRVLIEVLQEDQTLSSGLIIPESAKKKPTKGIIKAVGTGFFKANGEHENLKVCVDQTVLFNQWAANSNEIKEEEKTFIIIKEEDILAIIEN
ncbi:MAG TPA: co-chaperone GroES [Alphaproteobacteria bacterium]|nr:co-chaperone GroES [Alphaproteobacteria bacterium]